MPTSRPAVKPAYEVAWAPQEGPQTAAVECPVLDLFFGGARGGGKTDFLLGDYAAHASRWGQYAKGILFRRTYTELEEVISRSKEIYTPLGAKYNETTHTWTFPRKEGESRGATLKLRYLRRDSDADVYQGHSYTWLGFDELTHWASPVPIDKLWATLRSSKVPKTHLVRRSTGNPGGPGHAWVKQRYVTPAKQGYKVFRYQPQPELMPELELEAVFIPSRLEDNRLLDPESYKVRVAAAAHGNKALLKAWLEGDWDVFVGQAFWEWRDQVHVVANRTEHLRRWRWVVGLDWGQRQGWIGLVAVGPEGDLVLVSEVYFSKIHAKQCAIEVFGNRWARFPVPEFIYADDQMWQDSGVRKGMTIASEFSSGLYQVYRSQERMPKLVKASKGQGSRRVKYNLMHRYLAWDERAVDAHGRLQPWGRPRLTVQARCTHFIRTLPALPVDPDAPEDDVDTDAEDHPYDGMCNVLLAQPQLPTEPKGRPPQDVTPGFDRKLKRKRTKWADDEEEDELSRLLREDAPLGGGGGYHFPRPDELVADE